MPRRGLGLTVQNENNTASKANEGMNLKNLLFGTTSHSPKYRWLLSVVCFIVLLLVLYNCINYVLRNKSSMENISTFYEEPRNSIDVIFAGTSHPLFAYSPMEMWNSHGIASYNMCQGGQMLPLTYYCIKESLRLQNPKVVVVDLYYLIKNKKYGNIERAHSTIDNMIWSPVKVQAILDGVDASSWSEFFFPTVRYHSRWNELGQRDFSFPSNAQRGCGRSFNMVSNEYPEVTKVTQSGGISDVSLEYLYKIIELCKEQDVKLIFTVVPYAVGEDNDPMLAKEQLAVYNQAFDIADEHGIPYVNYFELLEEIDFDFETDMFDTTHINILGAKKVSLYMAEYLVRNFGIKDRRSDPEYTRWHEDYTEYIKDGLDTKNRRLRYWDNLNGYLKLLMNEEDYLILMNIGGSDMEGLTDKAVETMQQCGIENDLRELAGNSWVAVIDSGELVYEEISDEKIQYVGTYEDMEIKIFSNSIGSYFNIIIDGKKEGVNEEGLNIVVYSKSSRKVIDSVAFDISSELCKAIREKK